MSDDGGRPIRQTDGSACDAADLRVPMPRANEVRLRVEAWHVHSPRPPLGRNDSAIVLRMPETEVVGTIDALGAGVVGWKIGQRVAAGFGVDKIADDVEPVSSGSRPPECGAIGETVGRGLIVEPAALTWIPEDFAAIGAVALLATCAAVSDALRRSIAREGELVGVLGLCAVGIIEVQIARHLGFRVVAMTADRGKGQLAKELGAIEVVDIGVRDPAKALAALGGATVIVTTVANRPMLPGVVLGLRRRGRILLLGPSARPIEISSSALTPAARRLGAANTACGLAEDGELALSLGRQLGADAEVFAPRHLDAACRRAKWAVRSTIVLSM